MNVDSQVEKKPRILVVDDDPLLREWLCDFLRHSGLETLEATNGEKSIKAYELHRPDLILMDATMPVMDGFEACKLIKQRDGDRDTPILMMTGRQDNINAIQKAFDLGAEDFVLKPVNLEILHLRIRSLIKRRRDRKLLSRGERWLVSILETVVDAIITIDIRGTILSFNLSAELIFGYTSQEIVGQNIKILVAEPHKSKHDDYLKNYFRTGKQKIIGKSRREFGQRKDGTVFPLHLAVSKNTFESEVFFTGIVRDLSQVKAAEDEIRKLARIVEDNSGMIVLTDPKGVIEYVNQAFLDATGYERHEVLGKTPKILNSGEQKPEVYQELWKTIQSGKPWRGEMQNQRKDKSLYWVGATISPLFDDKKRITHFSATSLDITKEKETELRLMAAKEEAERANRAKSNFLANMSHEIRTPMNGVIGMIQLLESTPLEPDQKHFLEVAKTSADLQLNVINDILDFSKIEAGKLELESIQFALTQTVETVSEIMAQRAYAKGLELVVSVDPSLPDRVLGDPMRLRQILINLIGNAIKFTKKGEVAIRVNKISGGEKTVKIRFRVIDTGVGITPEVQKRLFSPFTQADSSTTREYGGTGLGLVISKQLIEAMNGTIGIEQNTSIGTTFWFEIECLVAQTNNQQKKSTQTKTTSQKQLLAHMNTFKGRALVVEDVFVNQQVALSMLVRMGLNVDVVGNGRESIARVSEHTYDLIFMDIHMPIMDGFEATRHIRQLEKQSNRRQPIIAMTANALTGDREKCLQVGMDDYISKPVQWAELIALIGKWLPLSKEETKVSATQQCNSKPKTLDFVLDETILNGLDDMMSAIPGRFKRLMETYLESATSHLDKITIALQNNNSEQVYSSAHSLKSQSGSVGALGLVNLCTKMETAGRQKNLVGVLDILEQARADFNSIKPMIQARIDGSQHPS